jgi:Cu-Zn family superoxide dismutase
MVLSLFIAGAGARADESRVRINLLSAKGVGATIGTIVALDTRQGVKLTPLLKSLEPGQLRVLIRDKAECSPGKGDNSGNSAPPQFVRVEKDGIARASVTLPGLKLAEIAGHAIVLYAEDKGAIGARVACGVIR